MYEGSDPLGLIGRKTIAIADADGVAHINLPCGKYQIKVDHEKFLPKTLDYTLGTPASGSSVFSHPPSLPPSLLSLCLSVCLSLSLSHTHNNDQRAHLDQYADSESVS
jgi:hypothetical protein